MTFIETAEWGDYKGNYDCRLSEFRLIDCLNEDVEIIEEPKKIEKIEMVGCNVRVPVLNNELVGTDTPLALETTIVKVNELPNTDVNVFDIAILIA